MAYELSRVVEKLSEITNELRTGYVRRELYELQQSAVQQDFREISAQFAEFTRRHEEQKRERERQEKDERVRQDANARTTRNLIIGAVMTSGLALLVQLLVNLAGILGQRAVGG